MSDDRAGAGEGPDAGADGGPDAGADGKAHDEGEQESSTKTQDLAKAGRKDFDPNEGSD
jgi:hypothetical protein